MSGGAFDYFYRLRVGFDVFGDGMCNLEEMVNILETRHSGSRAATNARALLEGMRSLGKLKASLSDVFQSIEWVRSGDYGDDQVDEAVEEYEVKP